MRFKGKKTPNQTKHKTKQKPPPPPPKTTHTQKKQRTKHTKTNNNNKTKVNKNQNNHKTQALQRFRDSEIMLKVIKPMLTTHFLLALFLSSKNCAFNH